MKSDDCSLSTWVDYRQKVTCTFEGLSWAFGLIFEMGRKGVLGHDPY